MAPPAISANPKKLLVAGDEDVADFNAAHPDRLPLFGNLLESPAKPNANLQQNEALDSSDAQVANVSDESPTRKPVIDGYAEPPIKRSSSVPEIQLFYDLFFVANLNTFTTVHEVNDGDTLQSYIGFFALLWFTWLQVTLYDVRFGPDTLFERACKALQLGVMVGFAVVSPGFEFTSEIEDAGQEPGQVHEIYNAMGKLSLVLMASQLVLMIQHAVLLFQLRYYRKVILPLAIHVTWFFSLSMVFLGLYFGWNNGQDTPSESRDYLLMGWYIPIGLEASFVLFAAGQWKFLSLRNTRIAERLSGLTLIILGEGVIGLCGSVQKVGADGDYSPEVVGMIVCAVAINYFLWMLHFDLSEKRQFGTVRQIIWTILHFPYHVAILFVVEGATQLTVWVKFLDYIDNFWDEFEQNVNTLFPATDSSAQVSEFASSLNETVWDLYERIVNKSLTEVTLAAPDITDLINQIHALPNDHSLQQNSTAFAIQLNDIRAKIVATAYNWAAQSLDITPPENKSIGEDHPSLQFNELIVTTLTTVFVYFFVAAGSALILDTVLMIIGKRTKVRADYLNMAIRVTVGLGVGLIAVMPAQKVYEDGEEFFSVAYSNFVLSSWILPTLTIILFILVAVDYLLLASTRKIIVKNQNKRLDEKADSRV